MRLGHTLRRKRFGASKGGDAMKIELRRAAMTYQAPDGEVAALRDVTFGVADGEFVSIVGPSGCGKSTLLALIAGIEHPSGGEVLVDGEPVRAPTGKAGLMPQRDQLFDWRTIWGNVTLGLEVRHENTPEHRGGVHDLLEQYQLAGFARKLPNQLSGGMRQRVVIAIALACHPELIIADEPTTALDVTVQAQILSLLKDLQAEMGSSSILITHDLGVIAQSCDSVVVMYAGRVVEKAPVRELFANPRHAYTKGLLASIPQLSSMRKTKLPTIPGQVASIADFVPGCRFCQRQGVPAEELTERPPLVEISPDHFVEACPRCANL